ncbi:MAG: hypothetical protein KDN05_05665 [Verrucomicrobiae bacterium]|nr:hypothetical protein [Verrucomicrobiae bacterium]
MDTPERQPQQRRHQHRNNATDPPFDSETDSIEWQLLPPENGADKIRSIETGYPVYPDQFLDIVSHMHPDQILTRMGSEIRFVWKNGSRTETLDFIRAYGADIHPQRIEYVFRASNEGVETIHWWDVVDDLIVRPQTTFTRPGESTPFHRPPCILMIGDLHGYARVTTSIVHRQHGTTEPGRRLINRFRVG